MLREVGDEDADEDEAGMVSVWVIYVLGLR